jgi:hypothetical protein
LNRNLLRSVLLWPWHAVLLSALPVLQFWQKNFLLLGLDSGLRLLIVGAVTAAGLVALLRVVLGDWGRAGLVAAPVVLVLVKGQAVGPALSAAALAAAVALGLVLARRRCDVGPVTAALNAALLVLVLLPVGVRLRNDAADRGPTRLPPSSHKPAPSLEAARTRPDVYFIMADGLGSPPVLEALFRIDARRLTAGLQRRGARILGAAKANYPQTALSTASLLNLAPVPDLLEIPDTRSRDRRPLARLVADNAVARGFRDAGYRIVTFPSGYPLTRFAGPDARREPALAPDFLELYVLNDGFIPLLQRLLGRPPAAWHNAQHRRRQDYLLDNLGDARRGAKDGEPVFVFAHLLAPHPPFVRGAGGAPVSTGGLFSFGDGNDWLLANPNETVPYAVWWKNQALWTVQRLEEAVDAILAASPEPPVIIIQGDHGPGSRLDWDRPLATDLSERFGIFSAWILPPGLEVALRDDMTAMTTFGALMAALGGRPAPPTQEGLWFARMKHPYEYFPATAGP